MEMDKSRDKSMSPRNMVDYNNSSKNDMSIPIMDEEMDKSFYVSKKNRSCCFHFISFIGDNLSPGSIRLELFFNGQLHFTTFFARVIGFIFAIAFVIYTIVELC